MANQESASAPDGFEWDDEKAESNERKHQVSFPEAVTVFDDELAAMLNVQDTSGEMREVTIGRSILGRVLVVVTTERADVMRVISARKATAAERRTYQEGSNES